MIVLATAHAEPPLADDLIARWATSADRAHAANRKGRVAQYHSLLARAGVRALLFSDTGQNDWQLCADPLGKLSAFDAKGHTGPAICLSHTRGIVACGLTRIGPLGIDVERQRPRAFDAIAGWGFGEKERSAVSARQAAAFYRIWTLREAIGKATGEGLALVTDGRDRTEGPDEGIWQTWIENRNWLLVHYRIDDTVSLAAATLLGNSEPVDVASAIRWIDLKSIER